MKKIRFLSSHEMLSLDPNTRFSDSSAATPILKIICPNLVRIDSQMNIQPELAISWNISEDGLIYNFNLRPELVFHNGDILNAKSIVWNFERILDNRLGSLLGLDFDFIKSVSALSDSIVEFILKKPFYAFLHYLAGRCHIVADTADQPVGAGAFSLKEWTRGSQLTLIRFDKYWDPTKPKVDQVIVSWAPDGLKRLRSIEESKFDIIEAVPAKAADDLEKRGLIKTVSVASSTRLTIAFNCRVAPFNDLRMREAVAYTIDRSLIITEFIEPHGHKVEGVLNKRNTQFAMAEREVDLDKARKLVLDSGYYDGITIVGIMTNTAPVPEVVKKVQHMLAAVGINLDIRGYDDPPWWPLVYLDTEWQVAFQGMGTRVHPDMLFRREFCTKGSFNATGYSNLDLDQIVKMAQGIKDIEQQQEIYRQAEQIIHRDIPVMVLYSSDTLSGVRSNVMNFEAHPLGYWNIEDVVCG